MAVPHVADDHCRLLSGPSFLSAQAMKQLAICEVGGFGIGGLSCQRFAGGNLISQAKFQRLSIAVTAGGNCKDKYSKRADNRISHGITYDRGEEKQEWLRQEIADHGFKAILSDRNLWQLLYIEPTRLCELDESEPNELIWSRNAIRRQFGLHLERLLSRLLSVKDDLLRASLEIDSNSRLMSV